MQRKKYSMSHVDISLKGNPVPARTGERDMTSP